MKTLKKVLIAVALLTANCLLPIANLFSQCIPDIRIDGNSVIADENHPYGLKLPSWLTAGQTLERGNNVFSISVIEFTVNGTSLDYSQNLSITTPVQTVPANKVWKIESVHKNAQFTPTVVATYSTAGAYTFNPGCSGYYKIQAWGGGGGGGAEDWGCGYGGGGGGGGGYTEATFFLSSGTPYSGTVGAGGTAPASSAGGGGGTSIFNGPSSISATGGGGGGGYTCGPSTAGAGGTGSGGQANVAGQAGTTSGGSPGGTGGTGANGGGAGGAGGSPATAGTAPGGGGGGRTYCCASGQPGAVGAVGRVVISLGGGTISSSRVPCATLYTHGSSCAATPSCPTGWNDAGCGIISTGAFERSCYRCD